VLYAGSGGLSASLPAAVQDPQQPDVQPTPVVIKDPSTLFTTEDPSIGNAKAKVTIVEFSDFQCPYCRKFWLDTYGQLKKQYIDSGKVRFISRAFPFSFHPSARPAAIASLCAQEQGKFWEFRDKMFSEQMKKEADPSAVAVTITFGVADIKAWAASSGLNTQQFNSCLDTEKYGARVDADTAAGSSFGVDGTPSFFINGTQVVGAQPFSEFKKVIDDLL